jgi:pyridoxine 5-phosphate synthase
VEAAFIAERAGADSITVHLREDRRHIQDRDVRVLAGTLQTRMNLEMAVTAEMIAMARELQPADCCLVPEKREELTTEGGLDVVSRRDEVADAVLQLSAAGIRPSLFIDPDPDQLRAAYDCGAPVVELHTGAYADSRGAAQAAELERIREAARFGAENGLIVHAGHGLHYHNVEPVAAIPEIVELNIGHAVIARALIEGLGPAVARMRELMQGARGS